MDFDDLKIRTIREAYYTLPSAFTKMVPWCEIEEVLRRGDYEHFADTVRTKGFSVTTTDEINMEYAASLSECMCKLDLIQITAIHVLANTRVTRKK